MRSKTPSEHSQKPNAGCEIMATIPHQDYLDLMAHRQVIEKWKARGLVNEDNSLGLFSCDAEVAIYLAVRFGLMTAREVVAEIGQRFGDERKPSIAEVKRFWLRFRKCFLPKGKPTTN